MKTIFKKIIVAIVTFESKMVLKKYKPKIVAITGSVGKTSTKDAIYEVLHNHFDVRKSQKSFNSEIGIPLTILNCENGWSNPFLWIKNILEGFLLVIFPSKYPEILVLEVGADRPGDIKQVSNWLKPDVVVFTMVGKTPVHVEFFKTTEDLIEEKAYIVKALKASGTLIYMEDDPRVVDVKEKTMSERYSFGFLGGSYFKASHDEIFYDNQHNPAGMRFRVDYEGNSVPVTIHGALGRQHIYPILAASAVAKVFDINLVELSDNLSDFVTAPGRMKIIPGIKKSILIDDTYNASPIAVHEGLDTLSAIKIEDHQKKIAVIGDMMELGKYSVDEHKDVGRHCAEVVQTLVTVGVRAQKIAEGALNSGLSEKRIYQFEDSQVAGKFLEGIIDPGDIVYVKGSQSIRMERAVLEVMAEPQRAGELLVRQEEAWEKR